MKIKFSIKKQLPVRPEVLEEKIQSYLERNDYRVIEKGPGFIIFVDDIYSDKKRSRSDFTRIEEGKFEFHSTDQGTFARLIYLTSISYLFFFMIMFGGASIYGRSFIPIILSFAFVIPIVTKVYYLKERLFNEILES